MLGQTYFNMRYPPEPGTWGSGTRSVEWGDSSYFTNRWSASNSTGFTQYEFCEVDSTGNSIQVTDTLIDTTNYTVYGRMLKLNNGFFAEAASLQEYSSQEQFYGVSIFNKNGIRVSHSMDTNRYSYISIRSLVELPNKNLILVGDLREDSSSLNNQKLALIKTDSVGHQIWKKTYKMSSKAWNGHSISLCDDGGFIISGAEVDYNINPKFTRPLVMKLDSNGTREWSYVYGSITYSNMPAHGIIQTHDGGYVFVGAIGLPHWGGIVGGGTSPWAVGLDSKGFIAWADTLYPEEAVGLVNQNNFTDIELLNDGSMIVTGQRDVYDSTNTSQDKWRMHGILTKYSISGNRLWLREYRHPEVPDQSNSDHLLYDIDPTLDGGFVAVGYLIPSIDNTQDTWMIKVDSFGCLVKGCEVTSVPKIESSIAQLKIYPNPASEEIYFDITPNFRQSSGYELRLYDMVGKLVLTQTLHPYENTISVSHLKAGIYNYRLNETRGQVVIQ